MEYDIRSALSSVRTKPWWFRLIPGLWGSYANTIYPWMYVSSNVYADLQGDNPKATSVATITHELVHFKRQKEIGILKYGFKYLLSRQFRFEEELLAIAPQMKYLREQGVEFDIDIRARVLSSSMYLWCASYKEAKKYLDEMSSGV